MHCMLMLSFISLYKCIVNDYVLSKSMYSAFLTILFKFTTNKMKFKFFKETYMANDKSIPLHTLRDVRKLKEHPASELN